MSGEPPPPLDDLETDPKALRAALEALPATWDDVRTRAFAAAVQLLVVHRIGKYRQPDHPQHIRSSQALPLIEKMTRKVRRGVSHARSHGSSPSSRLVITASGIVRARRDRCWRRSARAWRGRPCRCSAPCWRTASSSL